MVAKKPSVDRRIWKFALELTDQQSVQIPKGARILSVGNQDGAICLWAMVQPENVLEERLVSIFGTGHQIDDVGPFIGTVQNGPMVWHVFQGVTKRSPSKG